MNDAPLRRRRWPTLVLAALTAAALTACLLFAGYLYLPTLVSERILAEQIRRLGFADFSGCVSRIGPYRAAAGPLRFGPADRPAIAVQSVLLDYSLAGLRRKAVRRVRISGVTVNVSAGRHGLALPGLDWRTAAERGVEDRPPPGTIPSGLDMTVETIEIRSGMLVLTWNGTTTYRVPFEADLKPEGTGLSTLAAEVHLYPGDQPLSLSLRADWPGRRVDLSLDGQDIRLDRFADLFHRIPGLDATGRAAVHASAGLRLAPPSISDVNLNVAWKQGRFSYAPVSIEPVGGDAPASFSAVSEDAANWQIQAGGMQVLTPAPVVLHALTADLDTGKDHRTAVARVDATVQPFGLTSPHPAVLKSRLPVSLDLELSQAAGGDWTAAMHSAAGPLEARPGELEAAFGGVDIRGRLPRFNVTAQGNGRKGTLAWHLDGHSIQASAAGAVVDWPSTQGEGELQFDNLASGRRWRGQTRVRLAAPAVTGNGLTGKLGDLELRLRFQQAGDNAPEIDGRLSMAGGRLLHKESALQVSGVRLDLPCHFPFGPGGGRGSFSIDRVLHDQRNLGGVQGGVIQKQGAYGINATFHSALFPKLSAAIEGTLPTDGPGVPRAMFSFNIPSYHLPPDSDLGRLTPAARGLTLSGAISAQGTASISSTGIRGDLDLAMRDGLLRMPQRNIEVAGIDARLNFPELPRLRSGPAQPIRFTRAAMGGIVVDGGNVDLQVESEKTLFVEKGRFSWCGGKVDVQSLRIAQGKPEYQLSLYCQRLGLSRILEQLGSVNARGTGTVNGRIPITFSGGLVRFDDGFLFSTPGEPGEIQLTGTEILTRGIPTGTPQFAQVDLAREALKDYAYDWARLGLVSEGEDFVMRLQFDGKPARPLPFVFKQEIGSFVRVEAGAQGSVFQGIGLDVNLRLPLNRLLQYKDIVNLME